jgi:hypothetical protein
MVFNREFDFLFKLLNTVEFFDLRIFIQVQF